MKIFSRHSKIVVCVGLGFFAGCAPYNPPPRVEVDPACLAKASETDRVKRAALEARCPKGNVATTQAGDLVDETASNLELTVNPKSEQDHRPNLINLDTLQASQKTVRGFKIERSDSGRFAILKSEFKGSCVESQKPKIKYSFFADKKLVKESESLLAGLSIESNKTYFLRVSVESPIECRNSSLSLVGGYETDGVEQSVQGEGAVIRPKTTSVSGKKSKFKDICLISKSSQSLNSYMEAEINFNSPLEVQISDTKSRIPFVSKTLLCGYDISTPDVECNYENVAGSAGGVWPSQVNWSCRKVKVADGRKVTEWTRTLQLKTFTDGHMTINCTSISGEEGLYLEVNQCRQVR